MSNADPDCHNLDFRKKYLWASKIFLSAQEVMFEISIPL